MTIDARVRRWTGHLFHVLDEFSREDKAGEGEGDGEQESGCEELHGSQTSGAGKKKRVIGRAVCQFGFVSSRKSNAEQYQVVGWQVFEGYRNSV